ncbi:hypothetical protein CEXT_431151 [Caerostris extrusa]|uniref:Pre-C2HC domain-containing protein n=1 Tax=Caerostris extrusa TaxID=172846 RepID=A0AAV4TI85_CAEEX|nr:hypothetical protein CEXT_431151 [Caerostris extrusa]
MCTNKADIAAALDPEKFKILNIAQLTSGRTKQPLPLFLIKIANSLVADEILKLSSLHGIRVTVEKYRRRNVVPQCQRCYGFYHSSENCFLKVHCGVCAGDHPTKECNLKPDAERKCINYQEAMQPSTEDARISQRGILHNKNGHNQPLRKSQKTKIHLEENSINRQNASESVKRSYANIISHRNEQAHPPTIKLPKNPTEVDLFSTLLKLVHHEEVNGPLLLIAYRAALPAIRKTNCLDEKYCIILEKNLIVFGEIFKSKYGTSVGYEDHLTETEEILEDQLNRVLTREYLSFLVDLLTKQSSCSVNEDSMKSDQK